MARILVVDDDPEIARLIGLTLSQQNHEVAIASDGKIALNNALQKRPDLIIADIVMPNMDGPSFISELWEKLGDRSIPVIFVTGLISKEEEKIQNQLIGSQFFIAKPFVASDLKALVAKALA